MIVLLRPRGLLLAMYWLYITPSNPNPWFILPMHFALALQAALQAPMAAVSETQLSVAPTSVFVVLCFL